MNAPENAIGATTTGMRRMLLLASILVVIIGTPVYLFPKNTDIYFSWTIGSPLTAAFLGGSYLAAFVLELLASREKEWANARVAVPAVFFFTSLTLVVTLVHIDKFNFNSPHWNAVVTTWAWLVVYLVVPFILGTLWFVQRRRQEEDPPGTAPLPGWARVLLLLEGGILVLTGIALLLAPAAVAAFWAWPLTPLTGRAVGAWGVGLGTAALHMARENDWRRSRGGLAGCLVFVLLQAINLMRYWNEFDWSSAVGLVYILLLAGLGLVSVVGVLRARGS